MFASWKKAGQMSLAMGAVAALGLLASPSAQALEGIQGRHAIFYPSLELIYQHDDNFFLTDQNETSADQFMARAHFVLEVPGSRQYLRVEYAPMYRNVDTNNYTLPDSVTHFWDLQARLKGSSVFGVDIHQHFALGNMQTFELDPTGDPLVGQELYASDARFWAHNIDVDFKWEGSSQGAKLHVGYDATQFDDINKAPAWYELEAINAGVEYWYKFTPLTSFNVGYLHEQSNLDYTPMAEPQFGEPDTNADEDNIYVGFKGELGRTTTGSAQIGLVSMNLDDSPVGLDGDWDGFEVRANVTKAFSRWSKLAFNATREVNFSAYERNLFYVSNVAAFTFTSEPQGSRVGWTVAGGFHRNSYDGETDDHSGTGNVVEREDDIKFVRAEVGYHPLEHLSLRLNYRHEERESNVLDYNYTDNIWIFQVQFGF